MEGVPSEVSHGQSALVSPYFWRYSNPAVLDMVSVIWHLSNPMVVCPVGSDKFFGGSSGAFAGDLNISNALSHALRSKQVSFKTCWCMMGWRHSVSWFRNVYEDPLVSVSVPDIAEGVKAGPESEESSGEKDMRHGKDFRYCFVNFMVYQAKDKVYSKLAGLLEEMAFQVYGFVEQHDIFGNRHSAVAFLWQECADDLDEDLGYFVSNLGRLQALIKNLRVEVPRGWNEELDQQWLVLKKEFVSASAGIPLGGPEDLESLVEQFRKDIGKEEEL